MRASMMGWLGLGLAAVLAFFLNAYAFVLYQLVQCDALDGRGIANDDRLAMMCGRDNSLVSAALVAFVVVGLLSLVGLVACWRRSASALGKVLGCALVVLAPAVTYLVLALVTD
jgi:hypothetical protein